MERYTVFFLENWMFFRCHYSPNDLCTYCNPNQNHSRLFIEINKKTLNFTNNFSRLFETVLKKNKIVNFILSDFKNSFKSKLIKIGWNLHNDEHRSQLNKIV